VPLLAAILGVIAFQYARHWQSVQRKDALHAIEKQFTDEENAFTKKRAGLRDELRKLENPAKDKAAGDAAPVVPDASAVAAKKKELEAFKADHKVSLEKFVAFFKSHQGSKEGWRAGMAAVGILVKDKNLAEASDILKTLLEKSKGIDFYQVQVRLMYIGILEDLKKFEDALAQVEIVQSLASEELKPRVLLTKARIQIEVGKADEANKTLDLIMTTYASSPEARQALVLKAL